MELDGIATSRGDTLLELLFPPAADGVWDAGLDFDAIGPSGVRDL